MNAYETEDHYVLPTYGKFPFALVRGEGNYVEDDHGRRYLDLYGGHAVSLLGHSHPRWVEALQAQLGTMDFYSNVCYHPERAAAAKLVVEHSYDSMRGVFFCNSGAEANETALKLARKHTGRSGIVAMNKGFHGRTIATLSVTGNPKLRDMFSENTAQWTQFIPMGDIDALRALDVSDVAAVILEPIQSLAGVFLGSDEYYRELRVFCTERGIQLIFDEVQTGSGRCGGRGDHWYIGAQWNVEPDLVTTAKGIAGGFPVGVVIANEAIVAGVSVGDHGSTFGGGPLAAAAVAATYRILAEDGLVERVNEAGAVLHARLASMAGGGLVREVRGLGYLVGIEFEVASGDVQKHLLEAGILVGKSGEPNTIRLLPPLTITDAEWDRFFEVLDAFRPAA